ncbi:uncharacterized protein LOC117649758 [Thrips palmi]|uniref:Uncharacterized protein LOC117649758 n=1 Tax=Thrips palmi TaxID=161013 RepID=A0A6P8ZTT3_THRPL|nr:uncharacterized protein LOC117649758 [Thrips palmi]
MMENLTAKQVVSYLSQACPDVAPESIKKIEDARVTGKRAVKWTLSDWSAMGLSYGDVVDIKAAIHDYNDKLPVDDSSELKKTFQERTASTLAQDETVATLGSTTTTLDGTSSTVTPGESSPGSEHGSFTDMNLSDYLNEEDSSSTVSSVDGFQGVENYFTALEIKKMSSHQKRSYVSAKQLYVDATKLGLHPKPPFFMMPNRLESSEPKKPAEKRKVCLEHESTNSTTSFCNTSKTQDISNIASTSNSRAGCSPQSSSASGSSSSSITVPTSNSRAGGGKQSSSASGSSSRPSMQRPSTSGSSAGYRKRSSSSSFKYLSKKKKTSIKRPKVRLSEAELIASLPSFDVESILGSMKKPGIKAVKKKLDKDGIVYDKDRKLLMRVLTRWLHYEHVKEIKLVTMDMKEGLAASIVHKYPLFKDSHPTKPSWWRILDREGPAGFIANCCVNILRSADPSERLRGGGKRSESRVSSDEAEEEEIEDDPNNENAYNDKNASWMNLTMPFAANKKSLVKGMQDSFPVRRKWILNMQPTVAQVLAKYLHLMSFGGEMLVQEFELIHPEKGNLFTQNFPLLMEKLDEQIQEMTLETDIGLDESKVLKACMLIATALPRPNLARFRRYGRNKARESVMPQLEDLVQFIPVGCNVETMARERRENASGPVQPYLLAMVPDNEVSKQFLVADSKFIELGSNSLMFGLDVLFKAYHVFNAEYPLGWKSFWEVVEHGVLGIEKHKLSNAGKEFFTRHGFDL